MVAKTAKKLQSLANSMDRKLKLGIPFEVACEQVGWEAEEARAYFENRAKDVHQDHFTLTSLAIENLKIGNETLQKIAKDGPRMTEKGKFEKDTDLEAAKELVKVGMDILKLMGAQRSQGLRIKMNAEGQSQLDLFDLAHMKDIKGPWNLREGID